MWRGEVTYAMHTVGDRKLRPMILPCEMCNHTSCRALAVGAYDMDGLGSSDMGLEHPIGSMHTLMVYLFIVEGFF
jgi:hypothetical protein